MNHPKSRFLSARRIVIIISVILGLVHVILFGWTLQRRSASAELNESKLVLEENLDQLQRINQDQLDALLNYPLDRPLDYLLDYVVVHPLDRPLDPA